MVVRFFYRGQFTLLTQLIILNYPVILSHRRSTTVSLETYPLYISFVFDFSQVVPMLEWDLRCYPEDIADKTNQYTALRTNAAYQGLKHPVKETGHGKFVPDFHHRYLTEDIPYGLSVIRGIADIAGVKTPSIDKVLLWAQGKVGKNYIEDGQLKGSDVASTRAPQRYGLLTLKDVLG